MCSPDSLGCSSLLWPPAGVSRQCGQARIWGLSQGQKHGVSGGNWVKKGGRAHWEGGREGRVEVSPWELGEQLLELAGLAWGKEAVLGGEKTELEAFVEGGQGTERDGVVT